MSLPKFRNTTLEQSQDVFSESFTYEELRSAGMQFKPIANKGNGRFIVAKVGSDVISIPCGKSVSDDHNTQDCEFGLTEDKTLVAYVGGSSWLD